MHEAGGFEKNSELLKELQEEGKKKYEVLLAEGWSTNICILGIVQFTLSCEREVKKNKCKSKMVKN